MIISKSQLPSKGLFTKGDYNFDIRPLNFKQLLDYIETPELTKVNKYLKDIRMLKDGGIDLSKVSLLDLDYLIFMKKAITISDDIKFNSITNLEDIGEVPFSFKLSQIKFIDFESSKIPSKVNLDGEFYNIKIPNVLEFVEILDNVISITPDTKLAQIKLYSLFEMWEENKNLIRMKIDTATRESAANLINLDDMCFGRIESIKFDYKGATYETYVNILDITENFFQDFVRHFRPDSSQMVFEQNS